MAGKIDRQTARVLVALGEHLRKRREAAEISQTQLAKAVGMEPTNLAKIERGQKNVTVDTLVRIARGLGVDLTVTFSTPKRRASG